MDAEQLNKALYEKMSAEQERYRHNLLGQSPEEILNHAYEYAMREDILMEMETLDLPAPMAAALLTSPFPLADVYKDFRDMETGHMDNVRECIEGRAAELLEAQLERTMDRDEHDVVELFGTTALFFNERVRREDVPEGLYCYDLRGSDNDPGDPISVERHVGVNHAGTILAAKPLEIPAQGYLPLGDELNFISETMTINEFKDKYACPKQVKPHQEQEKASGQPSKTAAKPSIKAQLAAAKAAQTEKPAAQQRQKDKGER